MRFEFATVGRILFGQGALDAIGPPARELGDRALVVTGRDPKRALRLRKLLSDAGVSSGSFPVPSEPTVDLVQAGADFARKEKCNLVIGYGGGSAMDAAKAIAALLANRGNIFDYLEIVGRNKPLEHPSVACIAIPTTAGTGAEVTRNAVLGSPRHKVKVSLRSPHLLPRMAVVDPQLTFSLPPSVTAFSGVDALTQLIEPFTSCRANPLADGFCREGMTLAARSLRTAYREGSNARAREDMCTASLMSGLALSNAGLGAVHGLAGPIGGMFDAPHGALCGALLPWVMKTNTRALRERQPESPALARYDETARLLTGNPEAGAEDGVAWARDLAADLGIPRLSAHGVERTHFDLLAEKAANASSMKANPLPLTTAEIMDILDSAW